MNHQHIFGGYLSIITQICESFLFGYLRKYDGGKKRADEKHL